MPKTKADFLDDIASVAQMLATRDQQLHTFSDDKLFETILEQIGLEANEKHLFALSQRFHFLRDDLLLQALKDQDSTQKLQSKQIIFSHICAYYTKMHQSLLADIQKQNLLTPFYVALLHGVHEIGVLMNELALQWQVHIETNNEELLAEHKNDEAVLDYLRANDLLQKDGNGAVADRAYSVLVNIEGGYKQQSYYEAFPVMKQIATKIQETINSLSSHEDEVFGQQSAYIEYFEAISQAFTQTDINSLIPDYANIDTKWMQITAPIQVGHPLEYYEDKYRKSVAIEWDIRLQTQFDESSAIKDDMEALAHALQPSEEKYTPIYDIMHNSLNQTQLYIGRPLVYYGSTLNGLFSAQVVPNDENVSKVHGKKIFAFAQSVMEDARAKPFMQIDREIFEPDFLQTSRDILFNKPSLWHSVYQISTIGHEYGHILWCDEESEALMNHKGQFKNVEEFKATTGGLLAYFIKNDGTYLHELLLDTIKRSVKLLIYKNHEEVQPYYVEALLHLELLFASQTIGFVNNKLTTSTEHYPALQEAYRKAYQNLVVDFYLPKNEPWDFLKQYIYKDEEQNIYLPKSAKVREFVLHFQALYDRIGHQIDTTQNH